jgi:hypothetical protein
MTIKTRWNGVKGVWITAAIYPRGEEAAALIASLRAACELAQGLLLADRQQEVRWHWVEGELVKELAYA